MKLFKCNSTLGVSRVAGILFLLSLVVPTLNWVFVLSRFISPESNASQNILNHELLFRVDILSGVATTTIILALAICLYFILKAVNRTVALVAFSFKMIEVILTATLALEHFVALLVLKGEPQNIELQKVFNLLIENYIFLTAIPGLFFGLSMAFYSYLFLKSVYVPGALALFGIGSYLLVIIYDSLTILLPDYAAMVPIRIIGSAPVCIFQLFVGVWLMCKGIKINTSNIK